MVKIYAPFGGNGSWKPSGDHFVQLHALFPILAPFWLHSGPLLDQFWVNFAIFHRFLVVLLPFLLSCFFFLFFGVCGWLGGLVLLVVLVLLVLWVGCSKKIAAQQPNNPTTNQYGPAECAKRSAALPVGESPACRTEMATILKIADLFFA